VATTFKNCRAQKPPPKRTKSKPSLQHTSGCPLPTTTHNHAKYTHKCMGGRTGPYRRRAMRALQGTVGEGGWLALAQGASWPVRG